LEGGGDEVGKYLVGIVSGKTVVARVESANGAAAVEEAAVESGEPAGAAE
jgi:hypothetical protein